MTIILVRDLHIALVHQLFRVSFHVFHQTSTCTFHCIGGPTQIHLLSLFFGIFLCMVLNLSDNFLYHNSHINSFVRLILLNLDVLGLVVDLFRVDLLQGGLLHDPGTSLRLF